MPELDFTGLRADVEAATRVPEFAAVSMRGRRVRLRNRSIRVMIFACIVSVLIPAGLTGLDPAPDDGGTPSVGLSMRPTRPDRTTKGQWIVTVHAVAGLRLSSLYAAVDVCDPDGARTTCSLQVVPLGQTAQDQRGPITSDELRKSPSDSLEDITLRMLSPRSLLLSAVRRDGQRSSRRINLHGGGVEIEPEPTTDIGPTRGDRLVQLGRHGELYYARQSDARLFPVPTTPDLENLTVVEGPSPDSGWWVTGSERETGQIAVAASHDQGLHWSVGFVGIGSAVDEPVLVTSDGKIVHLFVRTPNGIKQRRTIDGGSSWHPLASQMPWPATKTTFDPVAYPLGAVARADGTLLVWLERRPGVVYLESTDNGLSYHPTTGPGGSVLAVTDGYAAVADPPAVSRDGHTWTPLPGPAVAAPG